MTDLTIFIVDDDPFYINLFAQHLNNMGYNKVQMFDNGNDCLHQIHEKPDVIFLDYNMDTLTGYDVLKKIKRYDPNLYVVMVSAQEEIKPAIDALKHGAFDYIQKGENAVGKIKDVLQRIVTIKELLKKSKPNLIKRILSFI
jgi:DNA-binding NtrC family response regulator